MANLNLSKTGLSELSSCRSLEDAILEPDIYISKEQSAEFICIFCQCICKDLMDIGCKSGHIYCKECLESFFDSDNDKCPQCQSIVNRSGMRRNYFADRLLSKQRLLCPFAIQNCEDDDEISLYQCEWIGCYSDVIDHLQHKCKYGTVITAESIQKIREKYSNSIKDESLWNITKSEINSYSVFWQKLIDSDIHSSNHVHNQCDKADVQHLFRRLCHVTNKELSKLWQIVEPKHNHLILENEFYAAIHIARLHKMQKPKWLECDLNQLSSLPFCLNAFNIEKIRYGTNDSYSHQSEIDLETKICTFAQLKRIVGVGKKKKKKRRKSSLKNRNLKIGPDWTMSYDDICSYKQWFKEADGNNDGCVDGIEGRKFFLKSKLSPNDLSVIWSTIDYDKKGRLSEAQFYAFFHIVVIMKKNSYSLPKKFVLPSCLEEKNILKIMQNENSSLNHKQELYQSQSSAMSSNANSSYSSPSAKREQVSGKKDRTIDLISDWGDFHFQF